MYYSRIIEQTVLKYLSIFPVVGLTGPRQSGKSTLLLHLLKDNYRYVTFDDHKAIALLHDDPERFMGIYSDRVIFDEVQKVPEIFDYLKIAVDRDRDNYGKFILTGSSQLLLSRKISESLAGRIGLLTLLPFQYVEVPEKEREEAVFRGSFPEMVKRKYAAWEEWYSSYIETYLHKDVRELSNIGDLRDFRRFVSLLAANTSQLLNLSNYARDLGVAVSTVKRWTSILEASYVIFLLPPYYHNYGKRIVKSPKLYFYDVGLVSYLTSITSSELFEKGPMAGSIFENHVISEVLKKEWHQGSKAQFYFFRTNHGDEIDLIIDRGRFQELVEIKNSQSFKPQMVKTLDKLISPKQKGALIYRGDTMPFGENLAVTNLKDYLSKGQ